MWAPITAELVREVAYDTDHFTSRVGRRQHVDHRGRAADRRGARRSAATRRSTPSPGACSCRRSRRSRSSRGRTTSARLCRQRLDDMGAIEPGTTVVDAADAVRAAHPGQRDRPHARLPDAGRRPVPRVRPPHARGRQPRARGAPGRRSGSSTTTSTGRSRTTSPTRATTSRRYLLDVEMDGQKLLARARPRLDRPAAARRHRHDVERHRVAPSGTSPRTRRTVAGSSPSRS